ncbi:hypothetical protein D3C78_1641720 [compost metagenome]
MLPIVLETASIISNESSQQFAFRIEHNRDIAAHSTVHAVRNRVFNKGLQRHFRNITV